MILSVLPFPHIPRRGEKELISRKNFRFGKLEWAHFFSRLLLNQSVAAAAEKCNDRLSCKSEPYLFFARRRKKQSTVSETKLHVWEHTSSSPHIAPDLIFLFSSVTKFEKIGKGSRVSAILRFIFLFLLFSFPGKCLVCLSPVLGASSLPKLK